MFLIHIILFRSVYRSIIDQIIVTEGLLVKEWGIFYENLTAFLIFASYKKNERGSLEEKREDKR